VAEFRAGVARLVRLGKEPEGLRALAKVVEEGRQVIRAHRGKEVKSFTGWFCGPRVVRPFGLQSVQVFSVGRLVRGRVSSLIPSTPNFVEFGLVSSWLMIALGLGLVYI